MKKIKVLSLFDGISVAQQALKELGYDVEYYASEIDKYAIQITQKNHPNTKQLGDVKEILKDKPWMDNYFDLLIGGSPCQDLSIAKKNREGLKGSRSSLFWEYVRILKEVRPKYFVLENVASMPKEAKDTITEALAVEPIMINASLVSAQNRKRLFWTNIPNVTQPEDRGILLTDILEDTWDTKYNCSEKVIAGVKKSNYRDRKPIDINKKLNTLKIGGDVKRIIINGVWRYLTPIEYERGQSMPDNYTEGVSNTQRYKCLGNAFNKEVVKHILSFMDLKVEDTLLNSKSVL